MNRYKRPLFWGAIVIVMALGLTWWTNQQTQKRADVVRADLNRLCLAVQTDAVNATHRELIDSNISVAVLDAIKTRLDELTIQDPNPQWRFDIESIETSTERETFGVDVSIDNQPVISLNVVRIDAAAQTVIIGYNAPATSASEQP